MSDSLVRCQCAKIKGGCSDTSVSGKAYANLGCMRLAAQWTDSYPVAKFWFIWSDKLGLPEYPTVYITLNFYQLRAWQVLDEWYVLAYATGFWRQP